jgi:hypothetical protein
MRFVQGALAFEIEGHVQDGFDLFSRKVQVADQVAAM